MRKLLILSVAVIAGLASLSSNADAAWARQRGWSGGGGQGPFARLMEMERNKNAALRRMFGL